MTIDINDFIKERGGDPEKIRQSQRKRFAPEEVVDEVIAAFEDHRATQYEATQIGSKINATQKEIGQKKKAKDEAGAQELLKQKAQLEEQKKAQETKAQEKQVALNRKVKTIGNYVHDSVPVSNTEDGPEGNKVIETWPKEFKPEKKECLSHHEVLTRIDGYDPERGVKIVGHRGYCLTGYGLFLNLALINYGLEFLFNKGYKPNQPPFFMNRSAMYVRSCC